MTLAAQYYEQTGNVLAPGIHPPQSKEEKRVHSLIDQWEAAQQLAQHDRLSW